MSDFNHQLIVIPLLGLLAGTAWMVARMRDLWAAVMLTGIYSFLGASWMLVLDAPDVAFTEAAVGAGLSTVLMLATLSMTSRTAKPPAKVPWSSMVVVVVTGGALIYGTLDMPDFGDPLAPIHQYPRPDYITKSKEEIDVPNVVTAVLASYRGYDTLGETTVIFTAAVSVLLLMQKAPTTPLGQMSKATQRPATQVPATQGPTAPGPSDLGRSTEEDKLA